MDYPKSFRDTINEGNWKGFPIVLRDMILDLRGDDCLVYGPEEVLEYLNEAIRAAPKLSGKTAATRISWVGTFFTACYPPLFHDDEWNGFASMALQLACDAEAALLGVFPEIAAPLMADALPETGEVDLRCLRQDLVAGGCMAAAIAGDEAEFRRRLDAVVEANELNVRLEVEQSCALFYGEAEPGTRYKECFSGDRFWTQILAHVAYRSSFIGRTAEVAEACRRYIAYLEDSIRRGSPYASYLAEAEDMLARIEGRGC